MRFRIRRRSRPQSIPQRVYIVSSAGDADQVFATRVDAERFAGESPGARVSTHQVRQSVDDAVVVFERRVVVKQSGTALDQTTAMRRFIDHPHDAPDPADVEWFHDTRDSGWHVVGFGLDKSALDTRMQEAIDLVRRLSQAPAMEGAPSPTRPARRGAYVPDMAP